VRLYRLLTRLAAGGSGRPLPSEIPPPPPEENGIDPWQNALQSAARDDGFLPCFGEVLQHLAAQQASTFFDNMNPLALSDGSTLFHHFLDPLPPFYTLDDLADLIEQYVRRTPRRDDESGRKARKSVRDQIAEYDPSFGNHLKTRLDLGDHLRCGPYPCTVDS
jgi:hypothetical protein